MIHKTLIIAMLIFAIPFSAQISIEESQALNTAVLKRVNNLRKSKGLPLLKENSILYRAAKIQSVFQAEINTTTHDQSKKDLATPSLRVVYSGGDVFIGVGENVLMNYLKDAKGKKKSIEVLAEEMYQQWRQSPGHYQNMIYSEYDSFAIDFAVNKDGNSIYATNVFGTIGLKVANQLSPNAWGITMGDPNCKAFYSEKSNLVAALGDHLSIENGVVYLNYHDPLIFQALFKGAKDGLAIDLITEDQVKCGQANQLDASLVYDGVMLSPIYISDLLKNNESGSKYRLITPLGKIPEHLLGKKLMLGLIVIKDNKVCQYLDHVCVASGELSLYPVKNILVKPKAEMKTRGIVAKQTLQFNFKNSISDPNSFPKFKANKLKVYAIHIEAFTSVDGDSIKNAELAIKRRDAIKAYLANHLDLKNVIFTYDLKENWDLMKFQLECYGLTDIAKLKHSKIKELIQANSLNFSQDKMFELQRVSTAHIYYFGDAAFDPAGMASLNLFDAIDAKDWNRVNRCLYDVYSNPKADKSLIYDAKVWNVVMTVPALTQNAAALLQIQENENIVQRTQFLHKWLPLISVDKVGLNDNLAALYATCYYQILSAWMVPMENLDKIIHPSKVKNLERIGMSDSLKFNLNYIYLGYYSQTNNAKKQHECFNFVQKFALNHIIENQYIKYPLFCNHWTKSDLSIPFLTKRYEEGKLDKAGVFLLTQLLTSKTNHGEKFYYEIHEKNAKTYSKIWCKWVKDNRMILRDPVLKNLYCTSCKD
jgi:uncharacterized protein YkwD